ncbi:DUF4388 domain-containing protein [Desulfobulbus alkaliphilus]|uniref:DUF4388 domain-containing protein n=1 Tax=Desulfobulbus alkaliphilus TaxID=869814 RepID=UPI0019631A4B|nr:DUF4388 domain-containing protein [Desulfobulbus alkaliphilus]MBM9537042.1 DUF4388 domain-containing protein [Desulfobulbus alkaliphilus]
MAHTFSSQPDEAIALEGDIAVIAIENIFQLFDFAALTGKLEVSAPTNSGVFYFQNGALIHGLLQISPRRIGQILLESRLINSEQLQECLRLQEQQHPQTRFGQILIEKGYISADRLDETLLNQIKDSFFEALSWQEGWFRFYQSQKPDPEDIKLHARIDHLLLEGMVRIDGLHSQNL